MLALQEYFYYNAELKTVMNGLAAGMKEQLVSGLTGSARTLFIASVYKDTRRPILLVTHNLLQAQKVYEDLSAILDEREVLLFPTNETLAGEMGIASPELKGQRIEALNFWAKGNRGIVVAPLSGVRKILPPPSLWKDSQLTVTVGVALDLEKTLHTLVQMGYERQGMVGAPGEFSLRGGILDIYPLTEEMPLRIEFFDDEVDSIRSFSIEDQRSLEKRDLVEIGPATELPLTLPYYQNAANTLSARLSKTLAKMKDEVAKELVVETITSEIESLKSSQSIVGIQKYAALLYDQPASLIDYMPETGTIIFDEISRIHEMSEALDKDEAEWTTALLGEGKMVHDVPLLHRFPLILQKTSHPSIYLSLFLRHVPHTSPQNIVSIQCKQMQQFHGQMHLLKSEIDRWKKASYSIVMLASDRERANKLEGMLEEYEIEAHTMLVDGKPTPGKVQIMLGDLQSGFELPMQKIAILTEEEMFKKKVKKSKSRQKLSNAERIKSYSELSVGDYVVHVNHGIGKYLGIETLEINGIHRDYLHIRYQGTDQLYVPVEQIDQVQKYVGSEGKEPKVYKLGGTDWKKVKKKVESSVKDIAEDLIKLYAEREASRGYSFSPDSEMQREFEAAFPYNETDDQLRSISEIKKDMEHERPMDRLLCGDVGYGKTEVAIRAAFKAVMDGKQVAILVPTTILAQQHYETIRERFMDYPISIGLLSRFRSRKQQTETMKGLANGTVDIVVGTHRLLSKDIHYKDIGLLIIDEEQRFGVTHKEKIKQLKANIDVLTLTATPIPRTLHMSMLGVRDLSVIETPPENRFPVQTYVVEYGDMLVRESIERELARDGQVFYLYNRVEDIERKADEIANLVPDARVTYAHGKMSENELEAVMLAFLEGEYDVLVSTTIIETGVDIPNVNTLIVHDADRMGLSQLYQLRGRVGRSNRVAYAYFTYRRDKVLTEVAEKRLQAIKEFTELGSGFKIAMRDLSIRGAGNLLGAQQHGFIDSVGFDLYSQMLKEAIEQLRGTAKEEQFAVEIDLEIDAYIPEAYISDSRQKIDMYKRFRAIESLQDVKELQEEMVDRFGDYPDEVSYLLLISEMKVFARQHKIESIKQSKQDDIVMLFSEEGTKTIDGAKVFAMGERYGRMLGLGMEGNKLKIIIHAKGVKLGTWLDATYEMLRNLDQAKKVEIGSV